MTAPPDPMQTTRDLLASATRVVVLTGAGMSAESGVPTFRDAQTGLWERFSPEQLATEEAFRADPELVWSWYLWRARMVRACEPNAGHRALGDWQHRFAQRQGTVQIVTQNVDDLHERGGAEVLAHLHGSLFDYRCADCGAPAEFDPGSAEPGAVGSEEDLQRMLQSAPLPCNQCTRGALRPGIVWFGEMLPMKAFEAATAAVEECDLALVVGTSGLVQPAASLPYLALESGAAVVEINPDSTPLSEDATLSLRGTAAELLPTLLNAKTG
ncbi:MAG: NAD-dependent deacylase [Micrococcaceae bacterium]